ncbi:oligopeptide/dipeptide ABC transporter ATP-binding protein [Mesorhizobium sp. M0910]|uniref:oligopeptide/dipeptide ABC transporter ATP-binding protein n=1 Tax=Mesorhizobium sp. M0910 TaxID=2957025 RepID=UPI00333D93FB
MNFAIAPDDALAAIARAVILDAHSSLPSVAASSTRWCSYLAEVLEQGAVRDIFHSPGHPYTRALLWCAPGGIKQRTRNLPTIPGEVPSLLGSKKGCIFSPRRPHAFDRCVHETPGEVARCHLLDRAGMVAA